MKLYAWKAQSNWYLSSFGKREGNSGSHDTSAQEHLDVYMTPVCVGLPCFVSRIFHVTSRFHSACDDSFCVLEVRLIMHVTARLICRPRFACAAVSFCVAKAQLIFCEQSPPHLTFASFYVCGVRLILHVESALFCMLRNCIVLRPPSKTLGFRVNNMWRLTSAL